jgi:putative transcriptional regulator
MTLSRKAQRTRDAKRAIGKELLQAIRDVKAGRHGACHSKVPREIPRNK